MKVAAILLGVVVGGAVFGWGGALLAPKVLDRKLEGVEQLGAASAGWLVGGLTAYLLTR
ncbi:MAG: hypothetical protein ACOZIN_08580 [Myxococcota bacterium]